MNRPLFGKLRTLFQAVSVWVLVTNINLFLSMVQTRIREIIQKFFNFQFFEWLINVLLLVTTYIFTSEVIYEYLEGHTNFSVTEEPITVEDIPTFTICLESKRSQESDRVNEDLLKYGRDFTIQALNSNAYPSEPENNSTMITLAEGPNDNVLVSHRRKILLQPLKRAVLIT